MVVRIDHFEVHSKLGEGGMAEVLLGRVAEVRGGPVVIKRLLPSKVAPDFVAMFKEEARICLNLRHQNIVQVTEVGESDGVPYLVMEYLNGPTASNVVKRQKAQNQFDYRRVARMVALVADALHYCHDAVDKYGAPMNLVHRDVTPSNIIVTTAGVVKLLDFGVAKVDSPFAQTVVEESAQGKAPYMAPEQVTGSQIGIDHRVDVYATGVCLYAMTTGHLPYIGAEDHETFAKILEGKFIAPTTYRNDFPPALEAIINKAMAANVDDRFRTAAELAKALREFAPISRAGDTHDLAGWVAHLFPDWHDIQSKRIADGMSWTSKSMPALPRSQHDSSPSSAGNSGAHSRPPSKLPILVVGALTGMLVSVLLWWFVLRH